LVGLVGDLVAVAGRRLIGDGRPDLVDCCAVLVGDVGCVVDLDDGRAAPARGAPAAALVVAVAPLAAPPDDDWPTTWR